MKIISLKSLTGAATAFAILMSTTTYAQRVWDGGGTGNDLATADNWNPNGVPAAGETLQWNGTEAGNLNLTLNSGLSMTSPGMLIDITSTQTGDITILNTSGSNQNMRLNSGSTFTMASGAGAFNLGTAGSDQITVTVGATAVATFTANFTNNASNKATFGSNIVWQTGGGSGSILNYNISGTGDFDFVGDLNGNGPTGVRRITKSGSGTATFSGNNSNVDSVTINAGTLAVGHNNALGTTGGTLNMSGGTIRAADSTARTIANPVSLNSSSTFGSAGTGNLTFTGNVNGGATFKAVTVNGTTVTFANDFFGSGQRQKLGNGTLIISGTTNGTGTFFVNGGTLLVNGSTHASQEFQVSGAILGGSGTIGGSVTVGGSGVLAPGNSIESLSTGALTMNNNSTLAIELDSSVAPATGSDLVVVNGNLTLNGTVTLSLSDIATSPSAFTIGTTFSLINYSGTWNGGLLTFGSALANNATFTAGLNTWQIKYDALSGGSNFSGDHISGSFVNITAIPEPSTGLLLVAALAAMTILRRRRHS